MTEMDVVDGGAEAAFTGEKVDYCFLFLKKIRCDYLVRGESNCCEILTDEIDHTSPGGALTGGSF